MPSREEFERLALPLENDLYFAAISLCRNETDAQDLVQAAYFKAFRSFGSFARDTNFKAWMFTILRHSFIDLCRSRKQEPLSLELGEEVSAPVNGPPVSSLPLGELLPDDLRAAFRSLAPAHQVLLLLADIEGLAYREIADALGMPMGSVMSGLFNARSRLRAALGASMTPRKPTAVTPGGKENPG